MNRKRTRQDDQPSERRQQEDEPGRAETAFAPASKGFTRSTSPTSSASSGSALTTWPFLDPPLHDPEEEIHGFNDVENLWKDDFMLPVAVPQCFRKRVRESPDDEEGGNDLFRAFLYEYEEAQRGGDGDWVSQYISSESDLPSLEDRMVNLSINNPYEENSLKRHSVFRKLLVLPGDGAVNSYIKFRLWKNTIDKSPRGGLFGRPRLEIAENRPLTAIIPALDRIPHLPPDFGRGMKLSTLDQNLLDFYLVGFCDGRTLLTETNFWLRELVPMAAASESVRHAILALAGSYVLDYLQDLNLLKKTNEHYRMASTLVSQALPQAETHDITKGDSVISTILLLSVDDEVLWEFRKPKEEIPRWYEGYQVAKKILDHSDPGYRYYKRENVQCDGARIANANYVAWCCILTQPVTPLIPIDLNDDDKQFGWLLQGSKTDVHRIHGATGMSPKLLHTLGQITYFCQLLVTMPDSPIPSVGANRLERTLENFKQWSDFSAGYPSTSELLNSCALDETGKVSNPTKVTELTGETWVCAAKIYLQCRYFRKPLTHPDVIAPLNILLTCTQRMPYEGPLFTSQAPFFCVFIMALLSTTEADRDVARDWFEIVVSLSGASCRSSVPPVWQAVREMWRWMDEHFADVAEGFDENAKVADRRAWWEEMVEELVRRYGWISLT